jgi:hypothetical protein
MMMMMMMTTIMIFVYKFHYLAQRFRGKTKRDIEIIIFLDSKLKLGAGRA